MPTNGRIETKVLLFLTPKKLREIADKMDENWAGNKYSPTGYAATVIGDDNLHIDFYLSRDLHEKEVEAEKVCLELKDTYKTRQVLGLLWCVKLNDAPGSVFSGNRFEAWHECQRLAKDLGANAELWDANGRIETSKTYGESK